MVVLKPCGYWPDSVNNDLSTGELMRKIVLMKAWVERKPCARYLASWITLLRPSATAFVSPVLMARTTPSQWRRIM